MVSFTNIILAASVVIAATATPTATQQEPASQVRKRNTPNETGTNNGFYYQFWSEAGGTVNYENGPGGNYQVTWDSVTDFTSGKGWQTAEPRNISFSGTFVPGSNSYLAVYTWSDQGETYILENFGSYNPGTVGTHEGTLVSDGGTYDVWMVDRGNNYIQYWSIRQSKRTSGVVTTGTHYNWYASHGLTHNPNSAAAYQILSTEGYGSTGSSDMTVGEVDGSSSPSSSSSSSPTATPTSTPTSTSAPPPSTTSCPQLPTVTVTTTATITVSAYQSTVTEVPPPSSTPAPPVSTTTPSGPTQSQYGQCGGQSYSGPTACASPWTCQLINPYYSQCL